MRPLSREELKKIQNHIRWVLGTGGERADLRGANLKGTDLHCVDLRRADLRGADLRCTDLRNANLYGANLKGVSRRWLVYAGNIGSRRSETLYFADYDNVRCGCWNNYIGGTLAEFKERIDEVYPADSENGAHRRYRIEYLGAIKMFGSMREAYIEEKVRHAYIEGKVQKSNE